MGKYILAWIPMVVIAVANGVLREAWYAQHLSELQAHQASTVSGVVLLGIYMWAIMRIWRPSSAGQALAIGLVWLGLTLAFEFLFGHFVAGHSWHRLFQDYNLFAGRMWVAVPVWVAIAPSVFYRLIG